MAARGKKLSDAYIELRADDSKLSGDVKVKAAKVGREFGSTLNAKLKALSLDPIDLKADPQSAIAAIATMRARLQEMSRDADTVEIRVRTERAITQLDRFRKQIGDVGDVGDKAGTSFIDAFIGSVGKLMTGTRLGPVLGPPLIVGVAAAAPIITSTLSAAVTGGVALGVAGIGVAIAGQEPQVKASAAELKSIIGDELRRAAQPFVPELLRGFDKGKDAARELRPEFEELFADSAKFVQPLFDGVIGGARELIPHLQEVVRNADPVVDVLGKHGPRAADTLGFALENLSQDSTTTANALNFVLEGVEGTIVATSKMVEWTNKLIPAQTAWALELLNGKKANDEAAGASDGASEAFRRELAAAAATTTQTHALTLTLDQLVEASRRVHDIHLSAAEANLRYKDSLKAATEAADGHKRVSGEEESRLLSLARSTNTLTEGLERSGASTQQLTAHSKATRAEFIAVAEKMGFTSTQAKALADKYLAIPKGVSTSFTAPGLSGVKQKADGLYRTVTLLDGRVVDVKFTTGYQGNPAAFKAEGGSIDGPGPKGVDSQLIVAAPGEFMHRAAAVDYYGLAAMEAINARRIPREALRGYATGGLIERAPAPVLGFNPPIYDRRVRSDPALVEVLAELRAMRDETRAVVAAVERVAPGVGRELNGAASGMRQMARTL